MKRRVFALNAILGWGTALLACGLASGPVDSGVRPALPAATPASETGQPPAGAQPSASIWAGASASEIRAAEGPLGADDSYCVAKFGGHAIALDGCRRQARESYRRLKPVFRRASGDTMAMESKRLEGCVRRHGGQLGVDWMLVEHCFSRGMP